MSVVRVWMCCVAVCVVTLGVQVAPAAAQGAALSPQRFAALDAVYTAALGLDRDEIPASTLTGLTEACRGLDTSDAFQRELRPACLADVGLVKASAAFTACRTPARCRAASRSLRSALTSSIDGARRANYAVDAIVPKGACRALLHTSAAELRDAERLRAALRILRSADSEADLRRALRLIDRIDGGDDDDDDSATKERAAFRRACG